MKKTLRDVLIFSLFLIVKLLFTVCMSGVSVLVSNHKLDAQTLLFFCLEADRNH